MNATSSATSIRICGAFVSNAIANKLASSNQQASARLSDVEAKLANQRLLAQLLRRLGQGGLTMLVVTHELDPLADALDRVLTLTGGRLTDDRAMEAPHG